MSGHWGEDEWLEAVAGELWAQMMSPASSLAPDLQIARLIAVFPTQTSGETYGYRLMLTAANGKRYRIEVTGAEG